MITMPYVNFAELSKERDDNHVEDNLPSTLCKNGDKITIKLKNGKVLSGTFNGYWGEDNDDGLFIDDYAISESEIVDIIRNDIDNQINEVLRLAGVQLNENEYLDESVEEKADLKESRIIDKKTFFCHSIGRLLDYAKVLGKIRFIYEPANGTFTVGNAEYNTHIGLFADSINAGKYGDEFSDSDDEEKDEYYSGNIEGPELTGAIIMKNNTKNVLSDMPDSTNVIFEYSLFYLCNGLWFKDNISEYVNETPKQFY